MPLTRSRLRHVVTAETPAQPRSAYMGHMVQMQALCKSAHAARRS